MPGDLYLSHPSVTYQEENKSCCLAFIGRFQGGQQGSVLIGPALHTGGGHPNQERPRLSCDNILVSVQLVAELHSACNFPMHLNVVAIHREDLVKHVVWLVDDLFLLLVKHVVGYARR